MYIHFVKNLSHMNIHFVRNLTFEFYYFIFWLQLVIIQTFTNVATLQISLFLYTLIPNNYYLRQNKPTVKFLVPVACNNIHHTTIKFGR